MSDSQQFVRPYATYKAMQFDGSRESALAIDRVFPKRVAFSVEHDNVLFAHALDMLGTLGLHEVRCSDWLVLETADYGAPHLMSDKLFQVLHAPYPRTSR